MIWERNYFRAVSDLEAGSSCSFLNQSGYIPAGLNEPPPKENILET